MGQSTILKKGCYLKYIFKALMPPDPIVKHDCIKMVRSYLTVGYFVLLLYLLMML